MAEIPERILERLKKILALEKGEKELGNTNAAEAAGKMAQQLILQYNIDIGTLEEGERITIEEEVIQWGELTNKKEGKWVETLYIRISKLNLCDIILIKRSKAMWIIGKEVNIMLVKYFVEQLIMKIRSIEKIAWKEYEKDSWQMDEPEKRNAFRRGFYEGAVIAIINKLWEQKESMIKEFSNLPVIIKENEVEIKTLYRNHNIEMKKARGGSASRDGTALGYIKGKELELNKGISGTAVLNKHLLG